MRILVKFAKEFEHDDIEQDVEANQTVENLKVIISLSIPEFNTYDLYYKNSKLTNQKARLAQVFNCNDNVHEVKVVKKGASVLMMDQARAMKENLTNNISMGDISSQTSKLGPILIVIVLLIVFFGIFA